MTYKLGQWPETRVTSQIPQAKTKRTRKYLYHSYTQQPTTHCILSSGLPPSLTVVVLDPGVSDEAPQFERQREDVAVVAAVPHDERSVGLALQDRFGGGAADGPPVPATLGYRGQGRS